MTSLRDYFATLGNGKIALWCYLIWYLATVIFYFDPSPLLWLNSLGLGVVIGVALNLCVTRDGCEEVDHWQTVRLFIMPFCVSSFASLTKGHGFILLLPPSLRERFVFVGACLSFACAAVLLRSVARRRPA